MTAFIAIDDGSYNKDKVSLVTEAFRTDGVAAASMAAAVMGGTLVPVKTLAAFASFECMTLWERAGVIDELRDQLDRHLDALFSTTVRRAQALTPVKAVTP